MSIKLNLIAAACENMGIGKNNNLPWRLKSEMEYFTRMTTSTVDPARKNVVIMGRKTWDSIPKKFKPLDNRMNFVLSRSELDVAQYENVFAFTSFEKAMTKLEEEEFKTRYEVVWVIGGSHVYKESMESKNFHRLYLTRVKKDFECDTFFPALVPNLKEITLDDIPKGIQCENGIEFQYEVYENTNVM